jgi:copper chaperone
MFRFKVEKMGCGGCTKSVTRAIHAVEPNICVEFDLGAKLVTVSGRGGSSDLFAKAIAAAGFPAEPV